MKTVFHIDELNKWNFLSSNLKNLLKDDSDIDIVVLVNGEAVQLFTLTDLDLIEGVSYHLCQNSLNASHIEKEDLISGITIVPNGIIDILILQNNGYYYIKP